MDKAVTTSSFPSDSLEMPQSGTARGGNKNRQYHLSAPKPITQFQSCMLVVTLGQLVGGGMVLLYQGVFYQRPSLLVSSAQLYMKHLCF